MIGYKDPSYIVGGDTTGSIVGDWIRTTGFERAVFCVHWSAAPGNFNGTLTIEGVGDTSTGTPLQYAFTLIVAGGAAPTVASSYNVGTTSPGTLVMAAGDAVAVPEFVRLVYTPISGGQANHLSVPFVGRQ